MQLIDTHLHLYADEFEADRNAVVEAARKAGVIKLLLPNIDSSSWQGMMGLSAAYPGYCLPMMGLHPCYVQENYEEELQLIERELAKGGYVGVGEIGMDRHWSLDYIVQQEIALRRQLTLAHRYDLPVALHTRNANDEVIAILRDMRLSGLRGVFHCFSGTVEQANAMTDLGFYLGIGGVLTYKNGGLDTVLEQVDIRHLVLETDGPYLSPAPYRGKRNQPAHIRYVAEKLADVKNITLERAAAITTENARQLFRL